MAAKKKAKRPSQEAILKYGPQIARLKARMPAKRWKRVVRFAHKKGYTVEALLSGAPDALKERTRSSLRKEATRTISQAYGPAVAELDTRQRAAENLAAKRREDEARYDDWLKNESGLLDAQARAADAALAAEQQKIQTDATTAMQAARADSLQRMQQVGGVSDPTQSAALDLTDKDTQTQAMIANQRQLGAGTVKIGEDVRQVARSAMVANAAAMRAAGEAGTQKMFADISGERGQLMLKKAADVATLFQDLLGQNVEKAQANREFGMAAQELGYKQQDLAASIAESERKFKLELAKFDLDTWIARNRNLAERAKVQLGYDRIAATQGEKAADRALRRWVEKHKARQKDAKAGVTPDERKAYAKIKTAKGLIAQMMDDWKKHRPGALPPDQQRQHLRIEYGVTDDIIDVAKALYYSQGAINTEVRQAAKRAGIPPRHLGYFFG